LQQKRCVKRGKKGGKKGHRDQTGRRPGVKTTESEKKKLPTELKPKEHATKPDRTNEGQPRKQVRLRGEGYRPVGEGP